MRAKIVVTEKPQTSKDCPFAIQDKDLPAVCDLKRDKGIGFSFCYRQYCNCMLDEGKECDMLAASSPIRYQICEIRNGKLYHYYHAPSGKSRMSYTRATMLTLEEAREILKDYPHHPEFFMQSEYDCHFRETDENGLIIV